MRKSAKPCGCGNVPTVAHNLDRARNHHGFRGVPPPANFSLAALPDDALLTEVEVAAIGRWSTNTVAFWRRDPDHPLKWMTIHGGRVRYQAGNVKAFIATGAPPIRRPNKPTTDDAPPPCTSAPQQTNSKLPRATDCAAENTPQEPAEYDAPSGPLSPMAGAVASSDVPASKPTTSPARGFASGAMNHGGGEDAATKSAKEGGRNIKEG
jgi:hypothetical protein